MPTMTLAMALTLRAHVVNVGLSVRVLDGAKLALDSVAVLAHCSSCVATVTRATVRVIGVGGGGALIVNILLLKLE